MICAVMGIADGFVNDALCQGTTSVVPYTT